MNQGYQALITIDVTGPRVIAAQPGGLVHGVVSFIDITFDSAINSSTFGSNDITLTGPSGDIPVGQPQRLAGNTYRIAFATQRTNGPYELTVGPNVFDQAGNAMDQDGDGTAGDAFEHMFTISLPDLTVADSIELTDGGGLPITEAEFGSDVTVGWMIENIGMAQALGALQDQVWLSSDDQLSASG